MKYINIIAIFTAISINILPVHSAEVSVRWTMPTSNLDGTPITDLQGAKIYYGTESSNYTHVIDAGITNSLVLKELHEGQTYYINGTAYYMDGLESDLTDEVAKIALDQSDHITPKPPRLFHFIKIIYALIKW